jgi:hypothetical protein
LHSEQSTAFPPAGVLYSPLESGKNIKHPLSVSWHLWGGWKPDATADFAAFLAALFLTGAFLDAAFFFAPVVRAVFRAGLPVDAFLAFLAFFAFFIT